MKVSSYLSYIRYMCVFSYFNSSPEAPDEIKNTSKIKTPQLNFFVKNEKIFLMSAEFRLNWFLHAYIKLNNSKLKNVRHIKIAYQHLME